jgi:hypothetical protein
MSGRTVYNQWPESSEGDVALTTSPSANWLLPVLDPSTKGTPMSANPKVQRAAIAVAVVLPTLLGGCSILSAEGQVDPALASCPQSPIAADVRIDGSGSSSASDIVASRMAIIADVAHRTALCGGRLHVEVFSSSSSASSVLYDEDVEVEGATDQAKSRRVQATVDEIMKVIEGKYATAVASLPTGGSDIAAQLRLASEFSAQLPGYQLDEYLLTDGFNNVGVNLEDSLTADQAAVLAEGVPVPALGGSWLTVAGLGRVDDNSSSSAQTEALVAFYQVVCERAAAATCTVVTDLSARW